MTTPTLPETIISDDGHASTLLIAEPCWLFAGTGTNLVGGSSTVWVYRSAELRDEDDWYQSVLDLIGDAELLHSECVEDNGMMFGEAELSLYAVSG